jgi:hypothetical protein
MKVRNLILFLVVLFVLGLGPGVRRASPDSGSATFQYLAGGGAICGLFQGACPDIASADNGDTVEISGTGMLAHRSPQLRWRSRYLQAQRPQRKRPRERHLDRPGAHIVRAVRCPATRQYCWWSGPHPRSTLEWLGRDPDGNLHDWSAARPHRGINAQHPGRHQLQQTRRWDDAVHQAVINLNDERVDAPPLPRFLSPAVHPTFR